MHKGITGWWTNHTLHKAYFSLQTKLYDFANCLLVICNQHSTCSTACIKMLHDVVVRSHHAYCIRNQKSKSPPLICMQYAKPLLLDPPLSCAPLLWRPIVKIAKCKCCPAQWLNDLDNSVAIATSWHWALRARVIIFLSSNCFLPLVRPCHGAQRNDHLQQRNIHLKQHPQLPLQWQTNQPHHGYASDGLQTG